MENVGGSGSPPPGRIELGHRQPVVVEKCNQIRIAVPLLAGPGVVAAPQRHGAEPGGCRCLHSVGELGVARERPRAQDKVAGPEPHHDRGLHAPAIGRAKLGSPEHRTSAQYPATGSTTPAKGSPARKRSRFSTNSPRVLGMVLGELQLMCGLSRTLGCE